MRIDKVSGRRIGRSQFVWDWFIDRNRCSGFASLYNHIPQSDEAPRMYFEKIVSIARSENEQCM